MYEPGGLAEKGSAILARLFSLQGFVCFGRDVTGPNEVFPLQTAQKKKKNAFLSATSVVLGGLWEELHSWPDGNSLLQSNHRHAFWWHLQAEEQVAASFFGVVTNSANKTRHFHHKGCQSAIQIDIVTSPEAKNYRSLFFPAYNPAVPAVQKTIFLQILPTFDPEEHLLTSVLTPTLALLPTWHRYNADMSDRHR